MIAYRLHFQAANLVAVEIARGGEIGDPRIFSSTFTMQVRDGNTRVQPRRGAGPLYDIGIYCVNAARYLFRAEPAEVMALKLPGRDPRFASVDEAYAVTMRFPHERVAQFTCSFGAHDRAHYEVIGTEGMLTLDNAYEYAAEMTMRVHGKHGDKTRTFEQARSDRRRDRVLRALHPRQHRSRAERLGRPRRRAHPAGDPVSRRGSAARCRSIRSCGRARPTSARRSTSIRIPSRRSSTSSSPTK